MNRHRLLALCEQPVAITEDALRVCIGVLTSGEFFAAEVEAARQRAQLGADGKFLRPRALLTREGEPLKGGRLSSVVDGVAVIPVNGPLVRHADMIDECCGITSYEAIARDIGVIDRDPSVYGAVLSFESPGGEANGMSAAAAIIASLRGRKPIAAHVGGLAASAGYGLASACDFIWCEDSSILGSIGTRAAYIDRSAADAQSGIKRIEFVSSVSPFKVLDPKTDEGRKRLQAQVDKLGVVFVGLVAGYRGVTTDKVLSDFGQGDVLIGSDAVAAGLADRLGSLEATIAEVRDRARSTSRNTIFPAARAAARIHQKGTPMTIKATMADGKCNECGDPIAGDAAVYCAKCFVAGEEAKAAIDFRSRILSLIGKTDAAEALARVTALLGFERSALAQTGAKDGDEALGIISADRAASAELAKVREQLATQAAAQRLATFRGNIAAAIETKRILAAALVTDLVPMLDDENRERAEAALVALAARADQAPEGSDERKGNTPAAQLAAVCSALSPEGKAPTLTEGESRRVAAYLAKRPGASLPAAPREDPAPREAAANLIDPDRAARIDAAMHITRPRAAQ